MTDDDPPGGPQRPTPPAPCGFSHWLHPDDDLAPNRPGETLAGLLSDAGPPAARRRQRWTARLLRRPTPRQVVLRQRLAAEERLGAALDQLEALGWHTVHAVPLPGGQWISHLVIGPGGVFVVRTIPAPGRSLRLDDDTVYPPGPSRAAAEPETRLCRRAAALAQHALSTARGARVPVRPVLGLVGAARVQRTVAAPVVRLLREADIAAFGNAAGVYKPGDVVDLYATARDRRVWQVV